MIVTTTFDIQGCRIREYKGLVSGIIVRSPTIRQGCLGGFALAVLCCAARPHLAASEVEDRGTAPERGHLEQRAAAGLLGVVAMGGDGEDVSHGG